MEDSILEPQTITLEWKLSNVWKEEIKALPAMEKFDCLSNRITQWIENDPQFDKNDGCQKHALAMFAMGLLDYIKVT